MKMVVVIDAVQLGTGLSMSVIVVGAAMSSLTVLYVEMRTISQILTLRSTSLIRVGGGY